MRAIWVALVLAATVALVLGARILVTRLQRAEDERHEADRGPAGSSTEARPAGAPSPQGVPTSPPRTASEPLRGIPAIRHFFRTNETPIYFVSATAFNLLGIDRWVRNFRFINYYDSFDGTHPNVFVPSEHEPRAFSSIEEICNYLLGHKEVVDYVAHRGDGGKVVFLMFDEETETLAAELGLEVAFPPAELRHRMDSKIETTRLGNEAGVPSVPNTMGRAASYREVLDLAASAGLGDDLVIQTPYGDSGQTTFFVASEDDWKRRRAEDGRRGPQGHETDRPSRVRDRGRDHPPRHVGGPADGRAHRLPRAHPVRRRVVRQRRLPRRAHRAAATPRP